MTKNKELKYKFIADMHADVLCVNDFVKVYGNKRLKPGGYDEIKFADEKKNNIRLFYRKMPFKDSIIEGGFYDDMECWLEADFASCIKLQQNEKPLQLYIDPNPVVAIGEDDPFLFIESNELHEKIKHFCKKVAEMK